MLDSKYVVGQSSRVDTTGAEAVEALTLGGRLVHMRWSQGELGRSGDNLYRVTFVAGRPHKLLIEFDEQVLAVLTEPQLSKSSDIEVVIGYAQMTLDWQEYGSMTPHSDVDASGELTIYRQGA